MVYIFALSRLNFVCVVFQPLLFKAFVGSLFLYSVLALLTQGGFNAYLRLPGTFRGVFRGVSRPSDVARPV